MAYRYMTVGWGAVASQPVTPECCDDHWNAPKRQPEKRGGDASFKCSINGGSWSTGQFGRLIASGVCIFFGRLLAVIVKRGAAGGRLIEFSNGADYASLLLVACIWPIWPRFPAITAVFAYRLNVIKVSSKATIKTTTGLESAKFRLFGEKKKGTIRHV